MSNFCLAPQVAEKFKKEIIDGVIDPVSLSVMTSAERHAFFAEHLGEANATPVNALFESKPLLKNQQAGMVSWARKTISNPTIQRDVVAKIGRMDKFLNPKEEKAFLKDLTSQRLGADVSYEEAQKITELSKSAQEAKIKLEANPTDKATQIEYGNKYLDLADYANSLKPQGSIFTFSNIINLPKSALTSILHFSAPFVQGWGMVSTKPFWEGVGQMFKYFADPQAYRDLEASIIAHPDYPLAVDGKLGITHLGDKLSTREEAIQSSLLEHVPVLNKLVLASSRGFTGFLNYVRFNRFLDLINSARLSGEDVSKGSSAVRDIAKTVNDFTGRGALGTNDRYASIQPVANMAFFSPRKISATINMFNPQRYLDPRISPTARQGAWRQLIGSILATAAVLELVHLAGAKVDTNPKSTNFLKIQVGKTTFDITGGNAIYIRLLARLATGQQTSSSGTTTTLGAKTTTNKRTGAITTSTFGTTSRADLILNYFRDKLSPTASAVADLFYGTDPVGQPVTLTSEMKSKLTPIVIQDFINMAQNDPQNTTGWLGGISAIFGVSMETPAPSTKAIKPGQRK